MPAVVAQHGDYHQIYTAHLRDSLASFPDEAMRDTVGELVVDGFDVVRGEYPPEGTLTGEDGWKYDGVMMTGSGESEMRISSERREDHKRCRQEDLEAVVGWPSHS